jgi:hypothetical protein
MLKTNFGVKLGGWRQALSSEKLTSLTRVIPPTSSLVLFLVSDDFREGHSKRAGVELLDHSPP